MKKSRVIYWVAAIGSLPFTLFAFDGEMDIAVVVSVLIGLCAWFVAKVFEAGATN